MTDEELKWWREWLLLREREQKMAVHKCKYCNKRYRIVPGSALAKYWESKSAEDKKIINILRKRNKQ